MPHISSLKTSVVFPAPCNFWDSMIFWHFRQIFFLYLGFPPRTFTIDRKYDYCTELIYVHCWQQHSNRKPMVSQRKSVTTKLSKKQISQFTSWAMLKQFYYLTTNFHERFVSCTYFLGQKVSTVVKIAKVTKCFVITCCYVKCYSAYLLRSCAAL